MRRKGIEPLIFLRGKQAPYHLDNAAISDSAMLFQSHPFDHKAVAFQGNLETKGDESLIHRVGFEPTIFRPQTGALDREGTLARNSFS